MKTRIRKQILAVSFTAIALLAAFDSGCRAESLQLYSSWKNNSGFAIYKFQMSSLNDDSWERDLLGPRVLNDGYSFTVTDIAPRLYDIRVIDEDRDSCVINGVRAYPDLTWNLSPLEPFNSWGASFNGRQHSRSRVYGVFRPDKAYFVSAAVH